MTVNVVDTINSRIVYYYYTTGDTLPTPATTDPKKEHIAICRDDGKKYQWNGTQWKEHASGGGGGGGGGDEWIELPSSEWSTHVFSVGDRIRVKMSAEIYPTVTADDWNTLPTISDTLRSDAMIRIIETVVNTLNGGIFICFENGTVPSPSTKSVTLCEHYMFISQGKINSKLITDIFAFNGAGIQYSRIQKSLSTYIKSIEYIPASA